MDLLYNSTRNNKRKITASQAILKGLSEESGLFVPESIPKVKGLKEDFLHMDYCDTACEILKLFFCDFTEEEIKWCVTNAYDKKFDLENPVPLVQAGGMEYMELFHGPTIAFKDMALLILPYLMKLSAVKNNITEEIVILAATSGDTGKAALNAFSNIEGIKVVVFYPKGKVSKIQELQMLTHKGENTFVIGVDGNFDKVQSEVKKILSDRKFAEQMKKEGFLFSSANSINIGRLIPQIVYYIYTYARMLECEKITKKEKINITVPTGNFGNILSAYYSKKMGMPIGKLICASNENKVLYDFFKTGRYDKNRRLIQTTSPSMDILVSGNLERLIYHLCENSDEITKKYMDQMSKNGSYEVSHEIKEKMNQFYPEYALQDEVSHTIKRVYKKYGYLIDPHTAVAVTAAEKYKKITKDQNKIVIVSTASPYKFTETVLSSVNKKYSKIDDKDCMKEMERLSGRKIPDAVCHLKEYEIIHKSECSVKDMKKMLKSVLYT